jgi:hypothetical protein
MKKKREIKGGRMVGARIEGKKGSKGRVWS